MSVAHIHVQTLYVHLIYRRIAHKALNEYFNVSMNTTIANENVYDYVSNIRLLHRSRNRHYNLIETMILKNK